jgi:hypothetical protein
MGISLFLIMIIIGRSCLSSYFEKQDFYPKFDVVEGSVIFRLSPVKQELLELKMLLKE